MRRHALLAVALAVFLAPALWLLGTAYVPAREVFSVPPHLLPGAVTLDNFRSVGTLFDIPRLTRNSVAISLGATLLALLLGTPAGYAMARGGRWTAVAGVAFLMVRAVPASAILIPFYLMMRDVGLLGTWAAVILVDAMQSTAFVVWMMAGSFRAIPVSVEEAAALDGAGRLRVFVSIALPMARTGLVTCALFGVLFAWNDFLFPAFLTTLATKPLSVALLSAYGTKDITWGTLGALAHVAVLPVVALALLLNRHFVQGITQGVN